MKRLLIIGAGGHGRVVADTAHESRQWDEICFLDDSDAMINSSYKILGTVSQLPDFIKKFSGVEVIVAVGDNKKREQLLLWVNKIGCIVATVVHPSAFVSRNASVEKGVVIFAQAVVNAYSKVGFGCIVNTGSIIEHDCILDCCAHVSPNAALAGGVNIGKYSWIGIGSNVIEKVKIGENAIVGAGSVVIKDISDNVVVVGSPARVIKKNE